MAHHMGGVDARDFIKGKRPWAQFLTYAEYLANHVEGSTLWAAQLQDERFLPLFEKRMNEVSSDPDAEPARPSLAGYSRVVEAQHQTANEIRMLRAELGKWERAIPILGPLLPGEKIVKRKEAKEISELHAAVQRGHQNWEEARSNG